MIYSVYCAIKHLNNRGQNYNVNVVDKRTSLTVRMQFLTQLCLKKKKKPEEKKELAQTLKTFSVEARKKGLIQCIIKQLLDSVFVIPSIIKVSVRVISLSLRLRLITSTSTLIILDITKTSSNNCCFLAWGFMFVLLCSFTNKKTGSVFPAFCHTTFHHALITYCNVSRAGYIACITIGIHLILVKAMWPRINQWQSLFSWVKV